MIRLGHSIGGRVARLTVQAGVAAALMLGLTLASGSPASAHLAPLSYHMICKEASPCINSGNLVRFWQQILWADEGYSDIDGAFGPNTHNATVHWQQIYNADHATDIDVDGWVGSETWLAAEQNTYWGYSYTGYDSTYFYYTYRGKISGRTFLIRSTRTSSITYFQRPGGSSWLDTSHGS